MGSRGVNQYVVYYLPLAYASLKWHPSFQFPKELYMHCKMHYICIISILYALQEDKYLTKKWCFSVTFPPTTLLHIDHFKSSVFAINCKTNNTIWSTVFSENSEGKNGGIPLILPLIQSVSLFALSCCT